MLGFGHCEGTRSGTSKPDDNDQPKFSGWRGETSFSSADRGRESVLEVTHERHGCDAPAIILCGNDLREPSPVNHRAVAHRVIQAVELCPAGSLRPAPVYKMAVLDKISSWRGSSSQMTGTGTQGSSQDGDDRGFPRGRYCQH